MKTVSTALKAHLAQTVTTLATCWQIVRTDGVSYAFTSCDQDLVIDGTTYSSISGFSRSAIATGSTGEVDNLDIIGLFEENEIVAQDMVNGRFDYATVSVFVVNWADLSMGICRMRTGWLGETVRSPEGIFRAELRGLTQALVQETGTNYQPICRADLGDSKCKMPIRPPVWQPSTLFQAGTYVQAATQNTDALLQAIFLTSAAGTTGSTEPAWNTPIGDTTADGGVTWTSAPYWRIISSVVTPLSAKSFTTGSLFFPAAPPATPSGQVVPGSVMFKGNVAVGTIISISDGVTEISYTFPFSMSLGQAIDAFATWLAGAAPANWGISYTQSNNIFYFNYNSGPGGEFIQKTGDTQLSVVIRDFTNNPIFGGVLTWLTGNNAGRSMEVKAWDSGTQTIELWLSMFFPIQVGDRYLIYPGCDKNRNTCFFLFNNIVNFRGEPDMPGLDAVLTYPTI